MRPKITLKLIQGVKTDLNLKGLNIMTEVVEEAEGEAEEGVGSNVAEVGVIRTNTNVLILKGTLNNLAADMEVGEAEVAIRTNLIARIQLGMTNLDVDMSAGVEEVVTKTTTKSLIQTEVISLGEDMEIEVEEVVTKTTTNGLIQTEMISLGEDMEIEAEEVATTAVVRIDMNNLDEDQEIGTNEVALLGVKMDHNFVVDQLHPPPEDEETSILQTGISVIRQGFTQTITVAILLRVPVGMVLQIQAKTTVEGVLEVDTETLGTEIIKRRNLPDFKKIPVSSTATLEARCLTEGHKISIKIIRGQIILRLGLLELKIPT
jgi:hypothetical protein